MVTRTGSRPARRAAFAPNRPGRSGRLRSRRPCPTGSRKPSRPGRGIRSREKLVGLSAGGETCGQVNHEAAPPTRKAAFPRRLLGPSLRYRFREGFSGCAFSPALSARDQTSSKPRALQRPRRNPVKLGLEAKGNDAKSQLALGVGVGLLGALAAARYVAIVLVG
jgi:hypothetical protein